MFDWFGRRHRVMPRHGVALAARTRADFPDMAPGIVATATYYDARITHAERLGLELLLDGMAANPGSLAVNHLALEGAEGGALLLRDTVGGALHRVEAGVVVNAAGAWIDGANRGARPADALHRRQQGLAPARRQPAPARRARRPHGVFRRRRRPRGPALPLHGPRAGRLDRHPGDRARRGPLHPRGARLHARRGAGDLPRHPDHAEPGRLHLLRGAAAAARPTCPTPAR